MRVSYEVVFEDGNVETYFANQIVETLSSSIDDEGYTVAHVNEFVDHKEDGSVVYADGFIDVKGKQKPRKTTKG